MPKELLKSLPWVWREISLVTRQENLLAAFGFGNIQNIIECIFHKNSFYCWDKLWFSYLSQMLSFTAWLTTYFWRWRKQHKHWKNLWLIFSGNGISRDVIYHSTQKKSSRKIKPCLYWPFVFLLSHYFSKCRSDQILEWHIWHYIRHIFSPCSLICVFFRCRCIWCIKCLVELIKSGQNLNDTRQMNQHSCWLQKNTKLGEKVKRLKCQKLWIF